MQVLDRIIKDFERANPGVKVDVQWAGREVLTKVRAALAAGQPPDLVDKDAEEVGALVFGGSTIPLDDVVSAPIVGEQVAIRDVVPPSYLDMFAVDGKPHLVPYEVITSGIWYNGKLFDQYGLSAPATWDEFISVIRKLRSQNVAPIAADGTVDIYNLYWLYWLAVRYGGPGALMTAVGDKTGSAWMGPVIRKSAGAVAQLVEEKAFAPGYEGSKWPAGQVAWARGRAAMLLMGTWAPSETKGYASRDFQYRMFPFPTVAGGYNSVEVYLIGWVIPKGAKNVELAKQFIRFAMNKNRINGIADVAWNIVPRPDVAAPDVLKDAYDLLQKNLPVHRVYDGIQAVYPEFTTTVLGPLASQLFFGRISADEFAQRMKNQSVEYWSRKSQ